MGLARTHAGCTGSGAVAVRRGRILAILAAMLLGLAATAASASPDPAAPDMPMICADGCEALALTVVADGAPLTPEAESSMAGIGIELTGDPDPSQSIVFVVDLTMGPMPPLRERLTAIEGMPHGRAAILFLRANEVNDPELTALILDEVRGILADHGEAEADTIPGFLDNDPDLDLLLRGLAVSP